MHMQDLSSTPALRHTCAHAQVRHSCLCSPTQRLGFPACKGLNLKIIMNKAVDI